MSPRRREGTGEILFSLLLVAPWWVGPTLALACFAVMKLAGSALLSHPEPIPKVFGAALTGFAPPIAGVILLLWVFSLVGKGWRRYLLQSRTGIESLRALSWRDFERLVGEALRRDGYVVEEIGGSGPDGGVDLMARRAGETVLVQCKRWKTWSVGVAVVREIYGVLMAEKASSALVVTTGEFTREARQFAEGKPIRLVDGEALVAMVRSVRTRKSSDVEEEESSGSEEAEAPPPPDGEGCPKCGAPMVRRVARKGPASGREFLGCSRYPACIGTRDLQRA